MSLHFLPWLSCSHPLVKVHSSKRWWKPSITRGFPPMMTCRSMIFSMASRPWVSIMSHDIRVTYSKFSVCSTRASRSSSGDIGSKAADGRCVGILDKQEADPLACKCVNRLKWKLKVINRFGLWTFFRSCSHQAH